MKKSAAKNIVYSATKVGIISDTHGLLRPEAVAALRGAELIVHAGDVGGKAGEDGKAEILRALEEIAPVVAVRGNVDTGTWGMELREREVVETEAGIIYVLHNMRELDLDPAAAGFGMVVSGHTHEAVKTERGGVIYLNPGSAGPRRFKLPVTVARVDLGVRPWGIEIVDLEKK